MATEDRGSITRLIDALKNGDDDATRQIWERYIDRLLRLARDRLRALPHAVADEEDVAQRAFDSFFAA